MTNETRRMTVLLDGSESVNLSSRGFRLQAEAGADVVLPAEAGSHVDFLGSQASGFNIGSEVFRGSPPRAGHSLTECAAPNPPSLLEPSGQRLTMRDHDQDRVLLLMESQQEISYALGGIRIQITCRLVAKEEL